ncbi:hypothetical protein TNCV_3139151 [Trichonephila clavipes]|nr:hypothetical protein TNCV_3139151 [Trichonephila clavipes]
MKFIVLVSAAFALPRSTVAVSASIVDKTKYGWNESVLRIDADKILRLSVAFQFTEKSPHRFQKNFRWGWKGKISRTQLQLSEEWKVWRTQLQLTIKHACSKFELFAPHSDRKVNPSEVAQYSFLGVSLPETLESRAMPNGRRGWFVTGLLHLRLRVQVRWSRDFHAFKSRPSRNTFVAAVAEWYRYRALSLVRAQYTTKDPP